MRNWDVWMTWESIYLSLLVNMSMNYGFYPNHLTDLLFGVWWGDTLSGMTQLPLASACKQNERNLETIGAPWWASTQVLRSYRFCLDPDCLISCSWVGWPANPNPHIDHLHWWRKWLGYTSYDGVGSGDQAYLWFLPHSWHLADPVQWDRNIHILLWIHIMQTLQYRYFGYTLFWWFSLGILST